MMTKTVAERITHDADAIDAALARIDTELETARYWSRSIRAEARVNLLPAPALTEQAIVDALKADPAMAGRVIASVAFKIPQDVIPEISAVVKAWTLDVGGEPSIRRACIQSLAVALAAASYRG